jgi:signal transduction histidine kinase
MRHTLRAFLPDRISVQIALLIVLSLAAIHVFVTVLFFWSRNEIERRPLPGPAGEIAGAVRLLASLPQAERSPMLQHLKNAFPRLELAPGDGTETLSARISPRIDFLRRQLGPEFKVTAQSAGPSEAGKEWITIGLPDGGFLNYAPASDRPPYFLAGPFFMTLMFILVSITLLALWAGRALIAPLRHFVSTAENFSPDAAVSTVPEQGPFEIRAAAKALNRMTYRIKGLIEDRTRMLAAMGHDLRTPITRMRLRSEYIQDAGLRAHMLHDLDQMRDMIDAALTYLREGHSGEESTDLDLAVLLQTACEEYSDLGKKVRYEGPAQLTIQGRPGDLQRAFTNLIDNALRYAGRAEVRLEPLPCRVRITIEDDGPGIPEADKARMLEPFTRGDAARGMNEAYGFGLGLSIANRIVLAHKGSLVLLDRTPQGLCVQVELEAAPATGSSLR